MRRLLVAAGVAGALIAVPMGSAVGASTGHAFKGMGTGTLTRSSGEGFVIDGHIKVATVGSVAFHSAGSAAAKTVTYTTTFTAANGDTITTSSTGTAKHTRLGRVYVTTDTVTGGTGRFATAAGKSKTVAKVKLSAPAATTGSVKFAVAGKIRF